MSVNTNSINSINSNHLIECSFLEYHDPYIALPFYTEENFLNSFGILKINMKDNLPITSKHIHLVFNIDCSASMCDLCYDGKTKMSHILFTLENMIRFLSETKKNNITIQVNSFDSFVYSNVENMKIESENVEKIIHTIKKIFTKGSTNIEKMLKKTRKDLSDYLETHPSHEVIHILLTDGQITDGSRDNNYLKSIIDERYNNIFIGYGIDHDDKLLSCLSDNKKGDYRFIDILEKAGLVYGEILNDILYNSIEEVELVGHNCEIYDFQSNNWVTKLYIGNLVNEHKKIYQIRSINLHDSRVDIYGKNMENKIELQYQSYPLSTFNDLTRYSFRQRTQELLFESRLEKKGNEETQKQEETQEKEEEENQKEEETQTQETDEKETKRQETKRQEQINKKNMKQKLKLLFIDLQQYMQNNDLENDIFMKTLCDDIYITYKTMDTQKANMYSRSRQSSQGRQQTYLATDLNSYNDSYDLDNLNSYIVPECLKSQNISYSQSIDFDEPTLPISLLKKSGLKRPISIKRQNNYINDWFNKEDTEDTEDTEDKEDIQIDIFKGYKLGSFLSPYKTNSTIGLMKEISRTSEMNESQEF